MSQVEGERVPLSALTEAENLPRLLVMSFGVWLYAADSTLVATLMPVAVEDIGGLPYLSWTYTLYQLGSVVTGAIVGLVVLRTGIVRAEIVAGVLYVLGCALSAYAPDMSIMILGRLLQGMGGGGFGGAVMAWTSSEFSCSDAETLSNRYQERFGHPNRILHCESGDGARVVWKA